MISVTQKNEIKIITALYNELMSHQFTISVDDGEAINKTHSLSDMLDWYQNLDEMRLIAKKDDLKGSVYFIFGNGSKGIYCIIDNSEYLEPYMTKTNELTEQLCKKFDV
ncbi:hypothetical protein RHO12_12595 (plasmid) [Orbus sturtevantii]|uniref:hypothetical protein n=1 Tax=Orbus sturtevantii TaxID=3074109 RepID=UPI00370D5AAE